MSDDDEAGSPAVQVAHQQHEYLGDVEHLGGGCSLLVEGSEHLLPTVMADVVLVPGQTLPLRLTQTRQLAALRAALRATGGPTERLFVLVSACAVLPGRFTVPGRRPYQRQGAVGCTAEVKQLSAGGAVLGADDGDVPQALPCNLLARGRQRVLILGTSSPDGHSIRSRVRVLPDGGPGPAPPPELALGYAAIHPALSRQWDERFLLRLAVRLCRAAVPGAVPHAALVAAARDASAVSFILAANLPIHPGIRQGLLECRTTAERLCVLVSIIKALGQLACGLCGARLANASNSLAMTAEGAGGLHVNAYGQLHDLLTVSRLSHPHNVRYQGRAETDFSWFPGYAWTICNCRCGSHLGWRFTATRRHLRPPEFWGLRRDALSGVPDSPFDDLGGEQHGAELASQVHSPPATSSSEEESDEPSEALSEGVGG